MLDALVLLYLRTTIRHASRGEDDLTSATALLMTDELYRRRVDVLGAQDVVKADHVWGRNYRRGYTRRTGRANRVRLLIGTAFDYV